LLPSPIAVAVAVVDGDFMKVLHQEGFAEPPVTAPLSP
jgi:hypothetical protein